MQGSNGDADRENRHITGREEKGEGWMNGESSLEIYVLLYIPKGICYMTQKTQTEAL